MQLDLLATLVPLKVLAPTIPLKHPVSSVPLELLVGYWSYPTLPVLLGLSVLLLPLKLSRVAGAAPTP